MKIRLSLISLALVAGALLPITPALCADAQQNTPAAAPAVTATPAAAPSSQAAPAGCGSGCGAGCGTTQAAPAGCGSGCGAGCGSAKAAPARRGSGRGASAAPSPEDALVKQLQLTTAQQKKLAAIRQHERETVSRSHALVMKRRDLVLKLIADPTTSNARIRRAFAELAQAESEVELAPIFAKRAEDKIYTPAQRAMLAKIAGNAAGAPQSGCGAPAGPAQPGDNKSAAPSQAGCGGGCGGGCGSAPAPGNTGAAAPASAGCGGGCGGGCGSSPAPQENTGKAAPAPAG